MARKKKGIVKRTMKNTGLDRVFKVKGIPQLIVIALVIAGIAYIIQFVIELSVLVLLAIIFFLGGVYAFYKLK